jgi:cytochrome b pre-mRNA-processing protein 3
MLNWLSNLVEKWARPGGDHAYQVYASIAQASRQPHLYQRFQIDDTLDGRFDTLTLIAVLVARRLKNAGQEGQELSQEVTDVMFADMDLSLHEIGVSENKVSKKVKTMATAYLGRMQAYVDALDKDDDDALADALARNLYRNKGVDARQNGLVALVKAEAQRLDQLSDPALLKGDLGPIFQL